MPSKKKQSSEAAVREIRRRTRRKFAPEEKIRIGSANSKPSSRTCAIVSPVIDSRCRSASGRAFLERYGNDYLVGALGLVLVISYWLQNVAVLSTLQRRDRRHATLVLVQLVFLLFYLVGVGLGVDFEMHVSTLLLQSASLLLMGIVAIVRRQNIPDQKELSLRDGFRLLARPPWRQSTPSSVVSSSLV